MFNTNQSTNSPFSSTNDAPNTTKENITSLPDDIIIHTMEDDLNSIKNIPEEKKDIEKTNILKENITSLEKPTNITTMASTEEKKPLNVPEEKNIINPAYNNTDIDIEENSINHKLVLSILILALLLISGAGAFYFLSSKKEIALEEKIPLQEEVLTQKNEESPVSTNTEEKIETITKQEEYSLKLPNYLPLNISDTSPKKILSDISTFSNNIKTLSEDGLYEFIIVNEDNSPIAFPIFASAIGITFNQKTFTYFNNNFSLFIHKNLNDINLGLSIETNNQKELSLELLSQEKTMEDILKPILPAETITPKAISFSEGIYNEKTIRYKNLNDAESVSIDYSISDKNLFVGTSKTTLRAILDKFSVQK